MPTRIYFEHTKFQHWGGYSGYLQFIKYLDPLRFEYTLVAAPDVEDAGEFPDWLNPLKPWLKPWIQQRSQMPWYKLPDLSAEANALRACIEGRTDIVHFLDGEHCGAFLPRAIKQSKLSNVRAIATFHQPPEVLDGLIDASLLQWLDAIVLMSPSQLDYFKKYVQEDKLHVLLHGVDTKFFHPARRPGQSGSIRCMTAGHWLRDWDTFKAVVELLPDIIFDVVTSQDEDFSKLQNVNIYKGISDESLANLYRNADILFLPLIESTANNALLEGIASGLPVVASDLVSIRAYLPGDQAILVENNSPQKFVHAIQSLAANTKLRSEFGLKSRTRAEELSWVNMVQEYESFYQDVLSRPCSVEEYKTQIKNLKSIGDNHEESRQTEAPLNNLLGLDPASCLQNGERLIKSGNFVQAVSFFKASIDRYSDDHRGFSGLAAASEAQWKWNLAIDYWNHCMALAPPQKYDEINARKAHCLIQIGEHDQARRILEIMHNRFEGVAGLATLADLVDMEASAALWNKCTIQFPEQLNGFLGKATNLIRRSQFDEANRLLDHVVKVWPESSQASVLWAECAIAIHDWETAATRWSIAHRKHGADIFCATEYAKSIAKLGFTNDPSSDLSDQFRHPETRTIYRLETYLMQGRNSLAIEQARLLLRFGDEILSYLRLASLLISQQSKAALQEALAILLAQQKMGSDSVIIKIFLCETYIRLGQADAAMQVLQQLPSSDARVEIQILKAWTKIQDRNSDPDRNLWTDIFLRFDLLGARRKEVAQMSLCCRNYGETTMCAGGSDRWRIYS